MQKNYDSQSKNIEGDMNKNETPNQRDERLRRRGYNLKEAEKTNSVLTLKQFGIKEVKSI